MFLESEISFYFDHYNYNLYNSRFEWLIDMFFNEVIPYVFWARGDIQQALRLFTRQIENETSSKL